MNAEAVTTFNQGVSGFRKQSPKMSRHRAHGTAVAKLGNKRLTNKEIAERCGPCINYDPKGFPRYKQFLQYSPDLQTDYLNRLQDKYDIGLGQINKYLFENEKPNELKDHCKELKILQDLNPGKKRRKTSLEQFKTDIQVYRDKERFAEVVDFQQMITPMEHPEIPKFMTYEEFKKLSNDDKVIFLNRLIDEYHVGASRIGIELFGLGIHTLHNSLTKSGISKSVRDGRMYNNSPEKIQKFHDDVERWKASGVSNDIPSKPVMEDAKLNQVFLDPVTGKFFQSSEEALSERIKQFNNMLSPEVSFVSANDFLDCIGVEEITDERKEVETPMICYSEEELEQAFQDLDMLSEQEKYEAETDHSEKEETIMNCETKAEVVKPDILNSIFSTSYEGTGVDAILEQLKIMLPMFAGKKVKARIEIETI
ncbi:MAG: hypothetical protein IJ899_03170 [Blautia sp.]|nr:hypothetical protein [Blautia sp.]